MTAKTPQPEKLTTIPYAMSLGDGQTLLVAVPAAMVVYDRSRQMSFTPEGIDLMDKMRALAVAAPAELTPGYLQTVRKALGLTQAEFAIKLRLSTITIKRWETGTLRPGAAALAKLPDVVNQMCRRGVTTAG